MGLFEDRITQRMESDPEYATTFVNSFHEGILSTPTLEISSVLSEPPRMAAGQATFSFENFVDPPVNSVPERALTAA